MTRKFYNEETKQWEPVLYRDGVNGKSAYECAVEGGYQGSEQQFYAALSKIGNAGNIEFKLPLRSTIIIYAVTEKGITPSPIIGYNNGGVYTQNGILLHHIPTSIDSTTWGVLKEDKTVVGKYYTKEDIQAAISDPNKSVWVSVASLNTDILDAPNANEWSFPIPITSLPGSGTNNTSTKFKLSGNNLYVSYDGGKTWNDLGRVVGQDGSDGQIGVDGNSFMMIFKLTETPELDHDPSTEDPVQSDSYVPNGWATHPQQVTETWEYQWVSSRTKTDGIWSKFSEPYIYNSYATEGLVPDAFFTSFVFCRTNDTFTNSDILPSGGSYADPIPENPGTIGGKSVVWTDGVPAGEAKIWMSKCVFSTDPEQSGTWTVPSQMSDTADFDVAYSKGNERPPQDPQSHGEHLNDPYWTNNPTTDSAWMATAHCSNGVWSAWAITKIKGEDGNDGTSVKIIGSATTAGELPIPYTGSIGDGYLVNGDLYVWDGDSWEPVGKIQGPAGETAYVHIKYATIMYVEGDESQWEDGVWKGWTENDGEVPGDYIGIYADHVVDDELNPKKYHWRKWVGDDGFGYEYIYKTTQDYIAPDAPTSSSNSPDYVPDGWSDDPVDVSATTPYCWMCYRKLVNNTWSGWIGSKDTNGKKAALWAKWGNDGADGSDGAGIEYIFAMSAVDTVDFAKSGLDTPNNSWEYDNPVRPWYDNAPKTVDAETPVCWYCMRQLSGITPVSNWSTPIVWNRYSKDGQNGISYTTVKLYASSSTQPYLGNNIASCTFDFATGKINGTDYLDINGIKWYTYEPTNTEGSMYYIWAYVQSATGTASITAWNGPYLMYSNGKDGSGQSATLITADPDTAIISVDTEWNAWKTTDYEFNFVYYYGTSPQKCSYTVSSDESVSVNTQPTGEGSVITVPVAIEQGTNISSPIPVIIEMTPTDSIDVAGVVTKLPTLTKTVYINPMVTLSPETLWQLNVTPNQIVNPKEDDAIIVTVLKDGQPLDCSVWSDNNVEINYGFAGEETNDLTSDTLSLQGIKGSYVLFTLLVNGQNILSETVSLLRDGVDGGTGRGITGVYEYYLWYNNPILPTKYVLGKEDVASLSDSIQKDDKYWTRNSVPSTNGADIYLFNIEYITYTDGDNDLTECALISSLGKGINNIVEYYLVTDKSSGITHSSQGWKLSYEFENSIQPTKELPYLWNYEEITYSDDSTERTSPALIGIWSQGEKGDKGDPGAPANNLSIDFSDDLGAVSVDSKSHTVIGTTTLSNDLKLLQGGTPITTGLSWKIVAITEDGVESARDGVDANITEDNEITKLTVTINRDVKITSKVIVSIKCTYEGLEAVRNYTILALPIPTIYQIGANVSYLQFDSNGDLLSAVESITPTIYDTSGSVKDIATIPSGCRVDLDINNSGETSLVSYPEGTQLGEFIKHDSNGWKYFSDNDWLPFTDKINSIQFTLYYENMIIDTHIIECYYQLNPLTLELGSYKDEIYVNEAGNTTADTSLQLSPICRYDGHIVTNGIKYSVDIWDSNNNKWSTLERASVSNDSLIIQTDTFLGKNTQRELRIVAQYEQYTADAIFYLNTRNYTFAITNITDTIVVLNPGNNNYSHAFYPYAYWDGRLLTDSDTSFELSLEMTTDLNQHVFVHRKNLGWNIVFDNAAYEWINNNANNTNSRTISLKASYRGAHAKTEILLSTIEIDPYYYDFVSINHKLSDDNSPVQMYITNKNDDYVSFDDLTVNGYTFKYIIDGIIYSYDEGIRPNTYNGNFAWWGDGTLTHIDKTPQNPINQYLTAQLWKDDVLITQETIERTVPRKTILGNIPSAVKVGDHFTYSLPNWITATSITFGCEGGSVQAADNEIVVAEADGSSIEITATVETSNGVYTERAVMSVYHDGVDGEPGAGIADIVVSTNEDSGTTTITIETDVASEETGKPITRQFEIPRGKPGEMGKMIYPEGEFNPATRYVMTTNASPYVLKSADDGTKKYYVLIKDYPADYYSNISVDNAEYWQEMSEFNAVYAEMLIADYGKVGAAVFCGDFMFSQYGYVVTGGGYNDSMPNSKCIWTVANKKKGDYHMFAQQSSGDDWPEDLEKTVKNIVQWSKFVPHTLIDFSNGDCYFGLSGNMHIAGHDVFMPIMPVSTDESITGYIAHDGSQGHEFMVINSMSYVSIEDKPICLYCNTTGLDADFYYRMTLYVLPSSPSADANKVHTLWIPLHGEGNTVTFARKLFCGSECNLLFKPKTTSPDTYYVQNGDESIGNHGTMTMVAGDYYVLNEWTDSSYTEN